MKKLIIILFLISSYYAFSQGNQEKLDESVKDEKEKIIEDEITEKKSANWQDVIANYFQLALKDLGGENQKFELKTTLFNLKAQANKDLWIDYNYKKEKFARNFQIEAGLSLKDDNKINSFTYGFGWSYNGRDRSENILIGSKSDVIFDEYGKDLSDAKAAYQFFLQQTNDPRMEEKVRVITDMGEKRDKNNIKIIPLSEFPEDFRRFLSGKYESYKDRFIRQNKADIDSIARRPYFFIGVNNSLNDGSEILDNYKIQTVFLKGIKTNNLKMEIDFRNSYKVNDSIGAVTYKRKEFSSQLGLNISIMAKNDLSFLELKPNFEFKRVFSGLMDNEKNNQFLANADLRIRVLKNLWVPLVLKYDIDNGKFFGFLNISFNFKAVKNE